MICSRVKKGYNPHAQDFVAFSSFLLQPVFSSQMTYCACCRTESMTSLSTCIIRGGVRLLISGQMDPTTLSTLVAARLLEQYQLD